MELRQSMNFNTIIKKRLKNENFWKNFCLFMIGMLCSSISVSAFFEPNGIVTTGSTGLSIVLNQFIKIDLALFVFAISSILLVLDFAVFGISHGSKNILGTILFPIFIKASSIINSYVLFDNTSLFLLILVGGVLSGIGFGLVKKSGFSLGSLFVFGLDKCIYSFIGLYISSYVGDKIMLGISQNKAFYIVTSKPIIVKDYIINNLKHTVTIVNASGAYSDKKKKLLLCVLPTREYTFVKEVIKEIDKKAFFLITDSYYVSK